MKNLATFYTFKTEAEAITLVNNTEYGLGAAIVKLLETF